jgi:hypothetical protein
MSQGRIPTRDATIYRGKADYKMVLFPYSYTSSMANHELIQLIRGFTSFTSSTYFLFQLPVALHCCGQFLQLIHCTARLFTFLLICYSAAFNFICSSLVSATHLINQLIHYLKSIFELNCGKCFLLKTVKF